MENRKIKILAIDDNIDNLITIKALIIESFPTAEVITATSGKQGIKLAGTDDPDVILLDVVMPDMDGFEVCEKLKADAELCDIPIVFVTALKGDKESRIRGLNVGAEAFLAKPIDESELVAQIRAMVKIKSANIERRNENFRLASLVADRTRELQQTHIATLNLLEDLRKENEARRKTEEALKESEMHFRTLADSGEALVWTSGLDKKCNYFNQPWLRFTGRTLEQEMGIGWVENVHPDDLQFCVDIYTNAFDRQEKFYMEYRVGHHSGEYRWISDSGSPRYNSNNEFIGFIGHCLDITERKEAERKIHESEALHRGILDASPDSITITDVQGNIIVSSPSALKTYGYDDDSNLIRRNIREFIFPDDLERVNYNLSQTLQGNLSGPHEYRSVRKDGSIFDIEVKGGVIRNADGEISRLVFIARDVTERKLTQNKIKQSEVEFRTVWESSANGLRLTDEKGNIVRVNEAFCEIFGKTKEELEGKTIAEIYSSIKREENIAKHKQRFIKREVDRHIEKELDLWNGEKKWVRIDNSFLELEGGQTLLLGIFTEITERKQAEEKLIESESRYNTFINNNVDLIFVKDEQFRYLVVNNALASFFGKSIDEILHKTDREIVDSDSLLPCASSDQKALETDGVVVVNETIGDRIFETTKFRMLLKNGKYGIGGISHDITKRIQSEKALEESRKELQTIYDNAPVMLCLVDEDRKILFANNTFVSNIGVPEEELTGGRACGVLGCINALDNSLGCGFGKNCKNCNLKTAMEDSFKTGDEHRNVEFGSEFVHNGEYRSVSFLASTALIRTSGKSRLLLSLHDITERKAAEEALRENNNRLELAMNVANMAWWEMDIATGNVWFEKRKAEMLGYKPEEFTHYKDFMKLVHPDDYEKAMKAMRNHFTNKADKYETDYRIRNKSGAYKNFYDIGSVSKRDAEGRPMIVSGLVIDMTERKKADDALKKSEMILRTFIENTPFEIWARDVNNIGILENKMIVERYGSILGATPDSQSIKDPIIKERWVKNNTRAFKGEIIDEETEYVFDGKVQTYQQIIFPIYVEEEIIGIAGFNIDITERKKAQEALRESQVQLKNFAAHLQNVREEERILLAREIHDELGQILVAIKIDLGMLKQRAQKFIKPDATEEFLNKFEQLSAMVDNTLSTARRIMTDLRPEVLDLLGFIDALRHHVSKFEERYDISCSFESDISSLDIDSQHSVALFRILQESLNNIAKHAHASEVKIRLGIIDNKIYLEIKDNGTGFDLSKKAKHDSYGLIGMKERAFLLDGELTISSQPGKGTTVRIEIPC